MPSSSPQRPWISGRALAVLLVSIALLFGTQGYQIRQNSDTVKSAKAAAAEGVKAHIALCALRAENKQSLEAIQIAIVKFNPTRGERKLLVLLAASRARAAVALDNLDGGCS